MHCSSFNACINLIYIVSCIMKPQRMILNQLLAYSREAADEVLDAAVGIIEALVQANASQIAAQETMDASNDDVRMAEGDLAAVWLINSIALFVIAICL